MSVDGPNYWCLVSSRFYTWGIRQHVLEHGGFGWSAPADLRKGDLVILYERGKPAGTGGFRGRMMFPIIARADCDAAPDDLWGHYATFTAVVLQPPVTWDELKADPEVANAWPAFQSNLRGNGGNHAIPSDVWHRILEHAESRDPGITADVAALARGDEPAPRSATRALVAPEEPFGPDVDPVRSEDHIERALLDFLSERGIGRLGTPRDGLPRKGGNGHPIPGHRAFCDLLVLLRDGALLVIEVESEAGHDPKHGVNQVVGYQKQLLSAGIRAAACVVAQSFTEAELARASEHEVECLEVALDPESGFFQIVPVGSVRGYLCRQLEREWRTEQALPWHDFGDPAVQVAFGFATADDGQPLWTMYSVVVSVLQGQWYDVTPLAGSLDHDAFVERYGGWFDELVDDFALERSVDDGVLAQLAEVDANFSDRDWREAPSTERHWPDGAAPYCLSYPEVAERFGLPVDKDGTVYPSLYSEALWELQEEGFDIGPLAGNLTEDLFAERYCDWAEELIADFGLQQVVSFDSDGQ